MTLAQRVKDCRYAKGWGPDELANRAEISRTALYQIESGKTEQPRAGTLRRIAEALSVPTEALLGKAHSGTVAAPAWHSPGDAPSMSHFRASPEPRDEGEPIRLTPVAHPSLAHSGAWTMSHRERDLERKFVELLRSPLGEGVAHIVEETHRMI